jgi:hypothetical protein
VLHLDSEIYLAAGRCEARNSKTSRRVSKPSAEKSLSNQCGKIKQGLPVGLGKLASQSIIRRGRVTHQNLLRAIR